MKNNNKIVKFVIVRLHSPFLQTVGNINNTLAKVHTACIYVLFNKSGHDSSLYANAVKKRILL